jgi:uncharacterized membrane protein
VVFEAVEPVFVVVVVVTGLAVVVAGLAVVVAGLAVVVAGLAVVVAGVGVVWALAAAANAATLRIKAVHFMIFVALQRLILISRKLAELRDLYHALCGASGRSQMR